jgi:hypothetical protein
MRHLRGGRCPAGSAEVPAQQRIPHGPSTGGPHGVLAFMFAEIRGHSSYTAAHGADAAAKLAGRYPTVAGETVQDRVVTVTTELSPGRRVQDRVEHEGRPERPRRVRAVAGAVVIGVDASCERLGARCGEFTIRTPSPRERRCRCTSTPPGPRTSPTSPHSTSGRSHRRVVPGDPRQRDSCRSATRPPRALSNRCNADHAVALTLDLLHAPGQVARVLIAV